MTQSKRPGKINWYLLIVIVVLVAAATVFVLRLTEHHQTAPAKTTTANVSTSGLVTLSGTVTKYDPSPAAYDGLIIFEIDGRAVDIGGGERPATATGSVYSPIAVGDTVEAKLKRTDTDGLTIYDCADCYVRKAQ